MQQQLLSATGGMGRQERRCQMPSSHHKTLNAFITPPSPLSQHHHRHRHTRAGSGGCFWLGPAPEGGVPGRHYHQQGWHHHGGHGHRAGGEGGAVGCWGAGRAAAGGGDCEGRLVVGRCLFGLGGWGELLVGRARWIGNCEGWLGLVGRCWFGWAGELRLARVRQIGDCVRAGWWL